MFNYPVIDIPKEINNKQMPAQELLLAIIRQESEFDLSANSHAGAPPHEFHSCQVQQN